MRHFEDDKFITVLHHIIRFAVRLLAILMTVVILWGVADVAFVLYNKLMEPPKYLFNVSDMIAIFGAFLAVLIAIEIFINIILYLREKIIHVKIVLATALMAIARKVIVFDFKEVSPDYIWSTGFVILAVSTAYWLVTYKKKPLKDSGETEIQ